MVPLVDDCVPQEYTRTVGKYAWLLSALFMGLTQLYTLAYVGNTHFFFPLYFPILPAQLALTHLSKMPLQTTQTLHTQHFT